MTGKGNLFLIACVVAALAVAAAAWGDPPARVGRLNFIQGTVSFMPGNLEEWTAATLNYPLTAGDSLWTEAASRAEVHVGSTAIRLGAGSEFSFLELDDQRVQISLPQGLLNVRLRELDADESFEIDTPTMSVSLLAPGSYRVEVNDSGDTQATVSEGQGEAVVNGRTYPLGARQTAFAAQSDWLSLETGEAASADEWDRWCAERDRREDRLTSVQYVPRNMIGCEDLDWYGSWRVSVEYGPVWTPRSLPAGWAPYRHGHWAWVEPWGWTWIDSMPWGFAPFHYGRWAMVRGVWVWVPGAIVRRPVYAPALVVFIEAGAVTADWRIGWFPLGPGEIYVPAYRVSHGYVQMVNSAQVRIGDREVIDASRFHYAHRQVANAYTVVPRQSFSHAQQVGDAHRAIPNQELSQTRIRGAVAPVVPQRESVLGAPRGSRAQEPAVSGPPEGVQRRRVIVRDAPSTTRTPFEEEQRELTENPGQPPEPRQQQAPRGRGTTVFPWVKQPRAQDPEAAPRTPQVRQGQQAPQVNGPEVRQGQQAPQAQEPQVRQGQQAQEPQVQQAPKTNEPKSPRKKPKVKKKKILPNGEEVWVEE